MILADACIVIDYQQGNDQKLVRLVESVTAAVCGVTRSEVLSGCRTPDETADVTALLGSFRQQPTPEVVWDEVGASMARLRGAGLKVPYPDVVVATLGIHLGVEVWSRDDHFRKMRGVLPGLRLFQEPG